MSIYADAERFAAQYGTHDPFELLDAMNVVVTFSDRFASDGLKGFCTIMNKTRYVVINDKLSKIDKRVVAGHEAGHIIRHASDLKVGAFQDNDIYMATGKKEREANVFAADFLIRDTDVLDLMQSYDSNFFNKAGMEMSQHLIPLYDKDGTIEIHHRLNQSFMTIKPDLSVIFRNAKTISSKWGEMTIPDTYDMLIILCYHMYYHNCYENEIRLSLHVDVIDWLDYIQKTESKDWVECLRNRVHEHGLFEAISYCIVQTHRLLEYVGFENKLDTMLLQVFADEAAKHKAEEIHSRFMLSESVFGYWDIPYIERIFMDKKDLEKEVAYAIYRRLIIEKWEPKLQALGIFDLYPQDDGHYW